MNVPTWQPTSSRRPLGREAAHVREALGEGRDAPLLLLDVAHVLDVAVGVLHREVVRARVHVDDPARAALDDAPEAAELARGRRVVALRVDRPRSASSRSARGSGRHRTAGSAPRPRCGRACSPPRRAGRRPPRLGLGTTWPQGDSKYALEAHCAPHATRRGRRGDRLYSRLVRVADHPRERPAWWALAAAALASFILHIPFLTTPLSVDEGGYGYVAQLVGARAPTSTATSGSTGRRGCCCSTAGRARAAGLGTGSTSA